MQILLVGEINNKGLLLFTFVREKKKISIQPGKKLIRKINRVIRMVLRGLDDVSEIVMRARELGNLARPPL